MTWLSIDPTHPTSDSFVCRIIAGVALSAGHPFSFFVNHHHIATPSLPAPSPSQPPKHPPPVSYRDYLHTGRVLLLNMHMGAWKLSISYNMTYHKTLLFGIYTCRPQNILGRFTFDILTIF